MELACLAPRPKLVVIGSGDLDFVPLVVRLRERGIKVVCVSERSKMAQDAVPAYDEVIYVGADQVEVAVAHTRSIAATPVRATPKKAAVKPPAAKTTTPKPAAAKKMPAKKTTKNPVATTSQEVTVPRILAALSNLKAGEWQPLGDVAKVLHDEKFLAKSATSSKLFKRFPHHFELMPEGKPNKVRYILSPK